MFILVFFINNLMTFSVLLVESRDINIAYMTGWQYDSRYFGRFEVKRSYEKKPQDESLRNTSSYARWWRVCCLTRTVNGLFWFRQSSFFLPKILESFKWANSDPQAAELFQNVALEALLRSRNLLVTLSSWTFCTVLKEPNAKLKIVSVLRIKECIWSIKTNYFIFESNSIKYQFAWSRVLPVTNTEKALLNSINFEGQKMCQ